MGGKCLLLAYCDLPWSPIHVRETVREAEAQFYFVIAE